MSINNISFKCGVRKMCINDQGALSKIFDTHVEQEHFILRCFFLSIYHYGNGSV